MMMEEFLVNFDNKAKPVAATKASGGVRIPQKRAVRRMQDNGPAVLPNEKLGETTPDLAPVSMDVSRVQPAREANLHMAERMQSHTPKMEKAPQSYMNNRRACGPLQQPRPGF
uniref:Uncharacterized protein n=1 Tax=Hanusia phi TaxID=3032 RepID=A0A7S0HAS1_9CRYP